MVMRRRTRTVTVTKNGVKFAELFDAFNLDNTVIKCLCNAASQKGGLRYAINLFKVANSAEQGNITVATIEEAINRVGKGAQFK